MFRAVFVDETSVCLLVEEAADDAMTHHPYLVSVVDTLQTELYIHIQITCKLIDLQKLSGQKRNPYTVSTAPGVASGAEAALEFSQRIGVLNSERQSKSSPAIFFTYSSSHHGT